MRRADIGLSADHREVVVAASFQDWIAKTGLTAELDSERVTVALLGGAVLRDRARVLRHRRLRHRQRRQQQQQQQQVRQQQWQQRL